ncbi:MAG: type ISP restriction/modification enzyme, partial [Candidatus Cloacimonadaceae bacterium]|nr:type ISP restriction/modification enzyme [Candidatus Cloacimonadaceae bacterium]
LVLDWGYWESKDEYDDLELEIRKKFEKGYPDDNIIFEDSTRAVLYQNGFRVQECSFANPHALDHMLKSFVSYERPEVREFRHAIELFKQDIPKVTTALRDLIIQKAETNADYRYARDFFLELMREVVNPAITPEDIREMVIQHILTSDIFNTIFDEPYFHQDNNIAHELDKMVSTFFTRDLRQQSLASIKHYYDTINARAAQIADHHEKQRFLKVVYETFYKSYSPKKADRLGVVYTPNEIVRFMVESTDFLLNKHFGKMLEDKGVDILDPATGTGTFICDIIDHISVHNLEYKYRHELHANEVEILPYYIANLNIEFTYKQKMHKYAEFENLCFVDTLDNYVNMREGAELDIFSVSDENAVRIKRQNDRKISVIIGNPPYNANQMNENENNKNREYPKIDKRIKDTYVKHSKAQKTKVYDMYARFYRWAMDRIGDKGIICYISNNSFINARTFDGFRRIVQDEFQDAYIIDLGGNIRELSGKDGIFLGEKHTIFGLAAMVGIAIMWLVKDETATHKGCRIHYIHPTDIRATRDEKIAFLIENQFKNIPFEHIQPDKDHNWINITDNNWDSLTAIAGSKGIFYKAFPGTKSNRDDWVFDVSKETLIKKFRYCCSLINNLIASNRNDYPNDLKWSPGLKDNYRARRTTEFRDAFIIESQFRPYVVLHYYADKYWNDRLTANHFESYGSGFDKHNITLTFNGVGMDKPFHVLASRYLTHHQITPNGQCVTAFSFSPDGFRHDNITDWGLRQFQEQYQDPNIGKLDIFHYVYGVLHDPAYRVKYAQNLKRSLPRVPFYKDFWQWAKWGSELMELHIGFESVEPWPLQRMDAPFREDDSVPKAKLKADKTNGIIILDEDTSISGIPSSAWDYKLGNRSALEWILDQYKEKKPK